jgi:putative hydrolase of the HAD superfamily
MDADSPSNSRAQPLVVVAGLIASGKSTLAKALAEALGATRIEADRVRGTLLQAIEEGEAGTEARWRRDLSPGFEQEIYEDLLRRSAEALRRGEPLVVDACFPLRAQRSAMRALAAKHARPFLFVFCDISDETRRARLAARDQAAGQPVWEAIYDRLAGHYEPLGDLPDDDRLQLRCEGATAPMIDAIRRRLKDRRPPPPSAAPTELAGPLPRIVSFDCWGTLLSEEDWHWAHTLRIVALREAAREAGANVLFEEAKRAFELAWHRHQALWQDGRASGAGEIADWGLVELGLEADGPVRDRLVRRFEEASHTGQVAALPGARRLLAALTRAGMPCVLVCDTGLTPGRVVRRLLDAHGLLEHLAVQSFSDEVGAPKPDRRPFLVAIEPFDVTPPEVMHVGDLRRTDVAGARALGMRSVRIRARHDDLSELPDADHVVDSHAELATLLGVDLEDEASEPGGP